MNPSEFIVFADGVSQSASSAAGYRSAVSRAYYGVFLEARDLLSRQMGYRTSSGGSEHLRVQRLLLQCSVPEGEEIARLLDNLHQSRKEADYDMHLPHCEKQSTSQLCVARAKAIEQKLQACSSGMVFTKIKLGIRAYLQKINEL